MKCSCGACSRSTTCSSTPACRGCPTEPEKVGAFEALGIERRILPSRLYRGAAGNTRRYFPLKLPVALEAERARVRLRRSRARYYDGAPLVGRGTSRPLGSAAGARPIHRGRGRRPHREGAAAGPDDTRGLDQHIYSIRPLRRSGTRQCGPPRDRPNRAGHPQAKDDQVLKEYGDLQACLKRIVELNDLHRSSTPGTLIHGFATWRSRRLPGGRF